MLGSKLAHRALTRLWRDYTTTWAGGSLLTFWGDGLWQRSRGRAAQAPCWAPKGANEVLSTYATGCAQFVDPRFWRVLI